MLRGVSGLSPPSGAGSALTQNQSMQPELRVCILNVFFELRLPGLRQGYHDLRSMHPEG